VLVTRERCRLLRAALVLAMDAEPIVQGRVTPGCRMGDCPAPLSRCHDDR
jgi:hypothetical protein